MISHRELKTYKIAFVSRLERSDAMLKYGGSQGGFELQLFENLLCEREEEFEMKGSTVSLTDGPYIHIHCFGL